MSAASQIGGWRRPDAATAGSAAAEAAAPRWEPPGFSRGKLDFSPAETVRSKKSASAAGLAPRFSCLDKCNGRNALSGHGL